MNKLKEDFRVGVLGAAAGLFSISVALMIGRIDAYYSYLSWLNETHYGERYYGGVEDLWWVPVAIWHLILSVTASLVVHRYLSTRLRSPFLLWQVIGTATLLWWGLTFVLMGSMEYLMRGHVSFPFSPRELTMIAKYFSTGFACNVVYASMMKACSRQYTAQFAELPSDSSTVDHLLTTS